MEKKTNTKVHANSHGANVIPFKTKSTPIIEETTVDVLVCNLCSNNTFHLVKGDEKGGDVACSSCGFLVRGKWIIK